MSWAGEIVIDATNAVLFPSLEPAPLRARTSSEIVAELVAGAWLVKAANTLGADVLGADPEVAGGRRVPSSPAIINPPRTRRRVVRPRRLFVIDLGDIVTGGVIQQAGGPLAGQNLVRLPPA